MKNQEGIALIAVVFLLAALALILGYSMNFAQNQRRLLNSLTKERMQNYYKAQSGVVDANWRIRTNTLLEGWGGAGFTDANFNPPAYYIDLETDAVTSAQTDASDVKVDIGPVNGATGLRTIESTGLDSQ